MILHRMMIEYHTIEKETWDICQSYYKVYSAMLCYDMICYVMLCYVVLRHVMSFYFISCSLPLCLTPMLYRPQET